MTTPYLEKAASMLGMNERDQRNALMDYMRTGGQNLDPATTAWCAAFVNSTLKQSGYAGTGSFAARSFLNYGSPVDTPQEGDIAVFSRGNNPAQGHVGFFKGLSSDGKFVNVLGGNQGNSVSVSQYPVERLLGYRRPSQDAGSSSSPSPSPSPGLAAGPGPGPGQGQGYAQSPLIAALGGFSKPPPLPEFEPPPELTPAMSIMDALKQLQSGGMSAESFGSTNSLLANLIR